MNETSLTTPVTPDATPSRPSGLSLARSTLGKLGLMLPAGISVGEAVRARDFGLYDYDFGREQEVSDAREALKSPSFVAFVSKLMAIMTKSVGGAPFGSMKVEPSLDERELFLTRMWMGDVLYMYTCLRIESVSPVLALRIVCPNCRNAIERYEADLTTLDIMTLGPDAPAELQWFVPLKDGFQVTAQNQPVKVTGLWVQPLTWAATIAISQRAKMSERKLEQLRRQIVDTEPSTRVKGAALYLRDTELARMSKYDYEVVTNSIDANSPGPRMSLDVKCPVAGCGWDIKQPIDWSFDSFFRVSPSPSENAKT